MPSQSSISINETYYGYETLQMLLNVDTNHKDYPKDENRFITTTEQSKLRNILSGSKYKKSTNTHSKSLTFQKKLYGDIYYCRIYPNNGYSLQSSWKFICQVISNGNVIGFDLSNSQPSILYQLCLTYGLGEKINFLQAYVENRDSITK